MQVLVMDVCRRYVCACVCVCVRGVCVCEYQCVCEALGAISFFEVLIQSACRLPVRSGKLNGSCVLHELLLCVACRGTSWYTFCHQDNYLLHSKIHTVCTRKGSLAV